MEKHYFDNYAHEGNEFLRKVASELGAADETDHAFRVTRAILHVLRDRITVQESMHLLSELPMAVKSVYVDGWNIGQERKKYSTKGEFLKAIVEESQHADVDFGSNPKEEVQAFFRVLRNCISVGEMEDVKRQLPQGIVELVEA